jgi:N-acetylneuraminate lyase
MTALTGIFAALMTPFDEADALDRAATTELVEFQVAQGLQGLYVGGSSGEAMLQSRDERAEVLDVVAEANRGRLRLIAHVGAVATRDVLALAGHAHRAGYAAISAIPPFYYPFSRAEVMAHYLEIADGAALPLIIYNFPAIATGFTMAEFDRLLAHPRIIGVKHTSTDLFALERLSRNHPDAIIYNGYDEMCLAGLAMGAKGAIGTTYNFMGDVFVELAALAAAGRLGEALALQRMANVVIEALVELGVMPASKAALEMLGLRMGLARKPFRRLDEAERARLRRAMQPVLDWRGARTERTTR